MYYIHTHILELWLRPKQKEFEKKKHASILRVGSYHIKENRKKINDLSLGNFNKMLSKNVGNG